MTDIEVPARLEGVPNNLREPAAEMPTGEHEVFISYSRADRGFVRRLHEALAAESHRAWVDWQDIPPTAEWMAEINAAIDASDAYIVVLSPDSVASRVCFEELQHAVDANKRIVPVLHRDVDDEALPEAVAKLNWILLREGDAFDDGLSKLVEALEIDLERAKAHTRILVRAREWGTKDNRSLLLRGSELREAESLIADHAEPRATPDQVRYVVASRRAANRRQHGAISAVAFALVLSLVLSVLALVQRNAAITERNVARSRELAAASTTQLDVDPELSLLLGIEAAKAAPTAEAADALRNAIGAAHLVSTLRGHENPIRDATFSPDGTRVLTTSFYARGYVLRQDANDYTARVWDAASGRQLSVLQGPVGAVMHAEFSPDGTRVLTSNGQTSRIWDAESGRAIITLHRLADGISHFSPDGQSALGIAHNSARIVDASSGRVARVLHDPNGAVRDTVSTPDGKLVIGWSQMGAVVWNAQTGRVVRILHAPFRLKWVSVSANGGRLLGASEKNVRIWDLDSGRTVRTWNPGGGVGYRYPFAPSLNKDGSRVVTMNGAGTATIWDIDKGKVVAELPSHAISDVEFSPGGSSILTVSEDHTPIIWDANSGDEIASFFGDTSRLWSGHFSTDGTHVVTAGSDLTARVWLVDPGAAIATLNVRPGGAGQAVAFSRDGTQLVTGGHQGAVRIWDVQNRHVIQALEAPGLAHLWVWGVAMSPDGGLVAASLEHRLVQLWDGRTGAPTVRIHLPKGEGPGSAGAPASLSDAVWAVDFSPDGRLLGTASQDGIARLWNPVTGELVMELAGHKAAVNDIVFSPDGRRVATVSDDGTGRIWSVHTGETLLELEGHTDAVTGVAWSPDGRLIATTSYDGTARLWDARTGRQLHVLTGSHGTVMTAGFSPNSRWLATISDEDGALRIWETQTGKLVDTHRGTLSSMGFATQFSPDGQVIAVSGFTGTFGTGVGETLLYRCDVCGSLDQLVALAEARVTRPFTAEERLRFLHEA